MDESGDLGFNFRNKKTSKFFVVSFLFVEDKKPVEKIVKKIFSGFSDAGLKHHTNTLHAYKERCETRITLLRLLNQSPVKIMSIYLNKKKVYTKLKDEKQILYNYITNILLDRVFSKKLLPKNKPILLVASRRETNKFLNQNFCLYLENQVSNKHRLKISIEIHTPESEKCLQIVDFISWAIFRKYKYGDTSYYKLINERITEENPLFP